MSAALNEERPVDAGVRATGADPWSELWLEVKKDPLYQPLSDILHWRDYVETGLIFVVLNFFFFLLIWGDYSIITLVSWILLSLLVAAASYVNYTLMRAQWSKIPNVENPLAAKLNNRKLYIEPAQIDQHLELIVKVINLILERLREVYLCTNNVLSAKFAFGFWVAAILGNLFQTKTLIFLGIEFAFIWPRLYEEKHAEIDKIAGIVRQKVNELTTLAISKMPDNIKKKLE